VILSEAKDLTQLVASHMLFCVVPTSIVRFLATLGMTMQPLPRNLRGDFRNDFGSDNFIFLIWS